LAGEADQELVRGETRYTHPIVVLLPTDEIPDPCNHSSDFFHLVLLTKFG
jgi:hypothetical protein